MSKQTHTDIQSPPANRNQLLGILGALGCILLFLIILILAYIPGSDTDPLANTVEQRLENLREVRSREAREMNSLEVVDAGEGTYKIPIEHAMELTVRDYQQQQQ